MRANFCGHLAAYPLPGEGVGEGVVPVARVRVPAAIGVRSVGSGTHVARQRCVFRDTLRVVVERRVV